MRYASISVGIVDYEHEHYRASGMRLRHATEDARAFSRYATFAGNEDPETSARHLLLIDGEAVFDRLSDAFADIGAAGPLDVFFLYLSGHGEQGDVGGGWFCLADAQPGRRSLGGIGLDQLLRKVAADHVCVVIDCCYAEAVTSRMTFFAELEGRSGRFLVASARWNQKSWEDENLQRSLFSDVLLRALSTDSPIATPAGYVDVEAGLFPHLREQLPLVASAYKRGHVQEPVTGGFSSAALKLPVVASHSLGRRLTTAQAIRTGVRRILFGAATAGLTFLVLLDMLAYHLDVGATGQILVRPGLQFSFALQPFHFVTTIDTGFRISDLDPQNGKFITRLASGNIRGLRTHLGEDGLRPWLGVLEEGLVSQTRSSMRILARGEQATFEASNDPPPIIEVTFLSRLLMASTTELGQKLYEQVRHVGIGCDADAARNLDFNLLLADPKVFQRDAAWWAAIAPADGDSRAAWLFELVKLNAYRTFHGDNLDNNLVEFISFAEAVDIMTRPGVQPDTLNAAAKEKWPKTEDTWCDLPGTLARAMAGDPETSKRAELRLWAMFETIQRNPRGSQPTSEQTLAAAGLGRLARRRALDAARIDALTTWVEADSEGLGTNTPPNRLVADIASVQTLPNRLTDFLVKKIGPPKGEFDFEPLTAARLLACNVRFLNDAQKAVIKQWLDQNAVRNPTMSSIHDALGCAALEWPLQPEQMVLLTAQLSPASRFPPRATNYRGETVITSNGDAATASIGKVAQRTRLDRDLGDQLANFAAARMDFAARAEILFGLAHQWYDDVADAESIYARLSSSRSDATRRNLEVEVAALLLMRIPAARSQVVATELIKLWRMESEPELRMAIARTVGSTSATPQ